MLMLYRFKTRFASGKITIVQRKLIFATAHFFLFRLYSIEVQLNTVLPNLRGVFFFFFFLPSDNLALLKEGFLKRMLLK